MGTNETTPVAATAGAAFGSIVGWLIAEVTGADTAPIMGPLSVVCAFLAGRYLP